MLNKYTLTKDTPLKYRFFRMEEDEGGFLTTLDICDEFDENLMVFIKKPDCESRMLPVDYIGRKLRAALGGYGQVSKNIIFFSAIENKSLFQFVPEGRSTHTTLKHGFGVETLTFSEIEKLRTEA